MTDHVAFPADGFDTGWTTWDGGHTEDLSLRWENEAWTVTGRVERERVEYVIRLSPLWQVRQFLLFRDLDEPDLWLGTDGHGRWGEMNGAHRPELDGAHDVALDVTPFTHSLPIRRLPLHVGDAFDLPVLHIDVETLAIEHRMVGYHRVGPRRWRISEPPPVARDGERTPSGGERIETIVEVDDHGLVVDLPDRFRRR